MNYKETKKERMKGRKRRKKERKKKEKSLKEIRKSCQIWELRETVEEREVTLATK